MENHPWGLFNMWNLGRSPNGLDEAEEGDLYWVIKAAKQGNLRAIIHMIHVYEGDTNDDEPDDEQALYWYRKAADQGYPWSESDFGAERFFYLGMRYRHGYGDSEADEDKAAEHFLAASNLGHPEAQYRLAELLSEWGDESESEHWLESSANLGYGPAQLAYAEYPFVPEEEADALIDSAIGWYRARAERATKLRNLSTQQ
ncbi:MAG: sel1 repeat family protein [Dechloromonas sp.]|nr:MAG: sel1 repeat family protein [Dechloromonas sp.]